MKIVKTFFRTIFALFRTFYKLIDKFIVVPITKLILIINDRLGNRTDRFEKWITRKNTLIFISLVLAVMLFLYIDSESNAIITDNAEVLYGQKVETTYNNNAYVVEGLPESVDVTLIGRQDYLYLAKQLSSGTVIADLSGLTEGMHTIKLDYDCAITSVEYKLDPSVVNVTIYPKVSQTRTLTVDVINKNSLDAKLSISNVKLDNYEIVIKGAEHVLSEVATVKALIDVKKIVKPEVGEMTLDSVKLVAYDSSGEVIKNVETEPYKIGAKVTIESPSKEVPLKIIPDGELEFGKAIDSISTNITKVTIYGDKEILEEIEYIPVEVDISGLNSNKTYDVIVSKPSGVKAISNANIKVTIGVGKEVSREIEGISIEAINLDSKYSALSKGENSSITTVVVKGTKDVIEAIDASMIQAQVDLAKVDLSKLDSGEEKEVCIDSAVKVIGEDNKASYTPKTTKIKVCIRKK